MSVLPRHPAKMVAYVPIQRMAIPVHALLAGMGLIVPMISMNV